MNAEEHVVVLENEDNQDLEQEPEQKECVSGYLAQWIRLNEYVMNREIAKAGRKQCE